MLAEHLARVPENVERVEAERVGDAPEDQHVVLDHTLSPLSRASRSRASFSGGIVIFSRAELLILPGGHFGS